MIKAVQLINPPYNMNILYIAVFVTMLSTISPAWLPMPYLVIFNNIWILFLLIDLVFVLLKDRKNTFLNFKRNFLEEKTLYVLLIVYYALEILNFFMSNIISYGTYKMVQTGKLSIFILYFLAFNDNFDKTKRKLIMTVGAAGVLGAIECFILYYTDANYYLYRMSILREYNVFAEYIFFGMICAVFYVNKYIKINPICKNLLLGAVIAICTVSIAFSGSRRGIIYLAAFAAVCIFYLLFNLVKTKSLKQNVSRIAYSIMIFIVVTISLGLNYHFFYEHIDYYRQYKYDDTQYSYHGVIRGQGETDIMSRYKTIFEYFDSEEDEDSDDTGINPQSENNLDVSDIIDNQSLVNDQVTAQNENSNNKDVIVENDGSNESTQENEAIESAGRVDIWKVAWGYFLGSDIASKIIGNGTSTVEEIYEDKSNPNALHLMTLIGEEKVEKQWMSPHNIFLSVLIEGGIIKLVLFLLLHLFILLKIFRTNDWDSKILLTLFAIEFAGIYILGGDKGFLSNELWIIMFLIYLTINNKKVED